jgi:hypothetical protein
MEDAKIAKDHAKSGVFSSDRISLKVKASPHAMNELPLDFRNAPLPIEIAQRRHGLAAAMTLASWPVCAI